MAAFVPLSRSNTFSSVRELCHTTQDCSRILLMYSMYMSLLSSIEFVNSATFLSNFCSEFQRIGIQDTGDGERGRGVKLIRTFSEHLSRSNSLSKGLKLFTFPIFIMTKDFTKNNWLDQKMTTDDCLLTPLLIIESYLLPKH